MTRSTIFIIAVLGTAATAIAAIAPDAGNLLRPSRHLTVIEKNQAFPVIGPIIVETCATEDCSDT